jgi:DNA-binding NarL/FixJ family response regulator
MSESSGVEAEGGRPVIRVFLLDDHEVVRRGLRDLLEAEPDIEVVGEAGTAESGMNRMLVLRPDVGLLDVRTGMACGCAVRYVQRSPGRNA